MPTNERLISKYLYIYTYIYTGEKNRVYINSYRYKVHGKDRKVGGTCGRCQDERPCGVKRRDEEELEEVNGNRISSTIFRASDYALGCSSIGLKALSPDYRTGYIVASVLWLSRVRRRRMGPRPLYRTRAASLTIPMLIHGYA